MQSERPGEVDLLVSGGEVFVDGALRRGDVGVAGGRIAFVGDGSGVSARETVDASGSLVVPGLIDMHTHVNWGNARLGINPDKLAAVSGVTTWVDAGSAGAGGVEGLLRHVGAHSRSEVVTFLNFSYIGLGPAGMMTREVGELWEPSFGDLAAVLRAAEENPGAIKGIKVRASSNAIGDNAGIIMPQAREAADILGIPLMLHVGMAPPVIDEVIPFLREGDLLTHCFHPHAGGRIVGADGAVRASVRAAIDRGVLLDVGHGNASISHEVTLSCLAQGVEPFTISSDMHAEKSPTLTSLLTVAEMFLAMGMPLADVLTKLTANPADALGRDDIGSLAEGTIADIAILRTEESEKVKRDSLGYPIALTTALRHVATFKDGVRMEAPVDDRREFVDSPWVSRFAQTEEPND